MNSLAGDPTKDVAVFVNDYYQEFADALVKLEKILNRKLRAVALVDSQVKAEGRNSIDPQAGYEEIVVDFDDDVALRQAIRAFEDNLLLVTTSADGNQPYLQRVLPFMPYVPGPTETSLTWATHKALQRRLMERFDPTLVPKYQMISSAAPQELEKVTRRLKFPVIVKPTGLAASLLVSKAHNEAELQQMASKSFAVLDSVYARDKGRGKPAMIVEEYMVGDMYTMDVYIGETGQVWALPLVRARTAHSVGREGFYEFQADSHIDLTQAEQEAGRIAAEAAVHAVGLRSAVAHIELFHTPSGWKIIELGPRAGGQRQDIYLAAYGIDHALNELLLKIGLEPQTGATHSTYTTTIYLYPDEEGVITAIEGVEDARANSSIYNLHVHGAAGQLALLSSNGGKWVVRGLLANQDIDQLYRDLEEVRSKIRIRTQPVMGVRS